MHIHENIYVCIYMYPVYENIHVFFHIKTAESIFHTENDNSINCPIVIFSSTCAFKFYVPVISNKSPNCCNLSLTLWTSMLYITQNALFRIQSTIFWIQKYKKEMTLLMECMMGKLILNLCFRALSRFVSTKGDFSTWKGSRLTAGAILDQGRESWILVKIS